MKVYKTTRAGKSHSGFRKVYLGYIIDVIGCFLCHWLLFEIVQANIITDLTIIEERFVQQVNLELKQ